MEGVGWVNWKRRKRERNMGHLFPCDADADPVCPVAMANYPYWEIIGHHGLQSMAVAQRWTVVVGHVGCRVVEGVYWQNDKQDKQFGFIFFLLNWRKKSNFSHFQQDDWPNCLVFDHQRSSKLDFNPGIFNKNGKNSVQCCHSPYEMQFKASSYHLEIPCNCGKLPKKISVRGRFATLVCTFTFLIYWL